MNTVKSNLVSAAVGDARIPVQLAGLDEESFNSAQESTPVPYLAGEGIIAGRDISPIYNQFARIAPEEARGKK